MTEITDDHVEWAVVDRLRIILEEGPHGKFNVTQTYALFSSILCWIIQRIRIPTHEIRDAKTIAGKNDRSAHALWKSLNVIPASEEPWSLPVLPVQRIVSAEGRRISIPSPKNFEGRSIGQSLVNIRDAIAHGDA